MLWGSGIQNVLHESTPNPILFEEMLYLYFYLLKFENDHY